MEENYQRVIKLSNIKIFKSEHYFQYFKSIFTLLQPVSVKNVNTKIKLFNIEDKYSIIKKNKINYWNLFYKFLSTPSDTEFPKIIDKYLQSYAKNILKKLIQLSTKYTLDINKLKQEYLAFCQKKISPTNRKRSIFFSPKKNLLILGRKNKLIKNRQIIIDNIAKNNYTPKPRNSIEKVLYKIKHKAFKEIVNEYIGNINAESLFKRKIEIQCMYSRKFSPKFDKYRNKLYIKNKCKIPDFTNDENNSHFYKSIKSCDYKSIKKVKLNDCMNYKSSDNIFKNSCFSEFSYNNKKVSNLKNTNFDKNNKRLTKNISYNNKYMNKVFFSLPLMEEKFGINNRYEINDYVTKNVVNDICYIDRNNFSYYNF